MLQWIRKNSNQTIKAAFLIGLFLGAAFLFFSPDFVSAQSIADSNSSLNEGVKIIEEPLGLPSTDIRLIIARIIRAALGLLGIILVVLIMYAGYLWMTAGGNEEQISKSKAMLKNAVVGLAIILSAYAIVWFIFRMLGVEGGAGGPSAVDPRSQNFQGSGALGQIVKDHYPMRNQIDVPRNTKIIITFRKPIQLQGLVADRSGVDSQPDGILGNCKENMTDWRSDCDRVTTTPQGILSNDFITIKRADTGEAISAAAIVAVSSTINGISGVYTIVLKPITNLDQQNGGYLGSPTEEISYVVRLGRELRLDAEGSPRVFDSARIGNDYYEWQFRCSTELDILPPFVDNVYPDRNKAEPKNSVIQIDFNEAMDPSGIQGEFTTSSDYFIAGEHIFLKTGANTSRPIGNFNLTNGYRTLEFTPSIPCGTNACGGQIFCLTVCDKPGATCNQDDYEFLLRAARTISNSTFEAQPFSGFMDVSGNALDGNKNKIVNVATTTLPVFNNWKQPDNDFWKFIIKDEIDLTSPYLTYVFPGLDAQFVVAYDPWDMVFSKRMRIDPMYDIAIEEKPIQTVPLCKVPRVYFGATFTTTSMNHCPFLDAVRQEYYPVLDSRLQDVRFNCFYPGEGPGVISINKISPVCGADGSNCCGVSTTSINNSLCCNGDPQGPSTTVCVDQLRGSNP